MKKLINKMTKRVVKVGCVAGLCIALSGMLNINEGKNSGNNELYYQIKSVDELKDYFDKFNVVDSKKSNDSYTVTLNNEIIVTYDRDDHLFYVNDGKSTEDFETIEVTEKYINKVLKAKYDNYKGFLIAKYGEDAYSLMNQEAGIRTEQEGFEHFIKYGI